MEGDNKQRAKKTCRYCGKSLNNVSRHQKEVHKIGKLRRQLDGYLHGEKRKPNRLVKFCPLSPCKYRKKGVFQLHHHLKSNVHKLKPKSHTYVQALKSARRCGIDDVGDYIEKRAEKKRKGKKENESSEASPRKRKAKKESVKVKCSKKLKFQQESPEFTDAGDEAKNVSQRKPKKKSLKRSSTEELKQEIHSPKINRDKTYADEDGTVDNSDHEEREQTDESEQSDGHQQGSDLSEFEEKEIDIDNVEERKGKSTSKDASSDSEYEVIAEKAWERSQKPNQHPKTASIIISDSDSSDTLDQDDSIYCPSSGSDSDSNSSETSSDLSCSSQENDDILTHFVEMMGEKNCMGGSWLDNDHEDWQIAIKDFISEKKASGYKFRAPLDSETDLNSQDIGLLDDSDEYLCDGSDDDVINELTEDLNQDGPGTSELLDEFHSWLSDVDGGYRSEKVAKQYKFQVQSIFSKLKMLKGEDLSEVELISIKGQEGVALLRNWLAQISEKYKPGTVISYLMSLRHFLKFLIQEGKAKPHLDTLNERRDLFSSWSSAQKKKLIKRIKEKRDEDFVKVLSSGGLNQICHGEQRVNTIKELGKVCDQTTEELLISNTKHCEIRDWLITRITIDNSMRSGVPANMRLKEFNDAVRYPGTEDDDERYRVLVKEHKTSSTYGAAVIWIYTDLYKLIEMYIKNVRPQFTHKYLINDRVFISSNGLPLTSSQVSTSIWKAFQREGVNIKGRVSATIIRKSLATGVHVHMPEEQENLAALAQHKPETQATYYRVNNKIDETDAGRRAVRKFVTMSTKSSQVKIQHVEWSVEETKCLKSIFQEEISTGNITEPVVKEKLGASNILVNHTLKAIVLEVRRMRTEYMEGLQPPSETEKTEDKVLRYLNSSSSETNIPVRPSAATSDTSSRSWNKFTDEQTEFLMQLCKDMVRGNAVKREVVWQRVVDSEKARQLELVPDFEDENQEMKFKMRLADKLRQEMRKLMRLKGKK